VASLDKSIGRGVMAVARYLSSMAWLTAGVAMWKSGLALHNGFSTGIGSCLARTTGMRQKRRTGARDSVEKARR
jgi:hypothetical protein